ncbi:MAG: hypothetical protein Q4B48_03500 [Syntrophomonadaceae bacterium]|nr:hypothetical protein [Syntrophomonadaceae bacterium]
MIVTFSYRSNDTGHKLGSALEEIFPGTKCRTVQHSQDSLFEYSFHINDYSCIFNLNPLMVVQRFLDEPQHLPSLLEAARIPFVSPAPDTGRGRINYSVMVYGRRCFVISQMTGSDIRTRRWLNEKSVPRIAEIAKNALYATGLDFAEVTIVGMGGRHRVTTVQPSPELNAKTIKRLCQLIASDMEGRARELQRDLRLGADPEFMLANKSNGKMIPASYLFPHDGLVGCDSLRVPNRQQRPIAEIRPRPSASPFNLFENIRSALQTAQRMAPYHNIKWIAGSEPFTGYYTGGHIHFSPLKANLQLLRALDNYVAVPLLMMETPERARARRKKYGMLGDCRDKNHGGFEYRTPASWLYDEELCLAALCLAKVVSKHYPELTANLFIDPQAWGDFYHCNKSAFTSHLINLWKDLRATSSYELYNTEIDRYMTNIVNGRGAEENSDVKAAWRIGGGGIYRNTNYENRYNRNLTGSINQSNVYDIINGNYGANQRIRRAPAGTGRVSNVTPQRRTTARRNVSRRGNGANTQVRTPRRINRQYYM